MKLGEYFFKRKIQNLIEKSRSRMHRFCSLDDADSILVLYRSEDREAVEPLLKKLVSMKKRIYACVSCSGIINQSNSSEICINKSKETDKYGVPNAELSDKIAKISADILIDLSMGKCHTLKALMLQHPSTFKVGARISDNSIHDFSIIMTEGGAAELFEHLLFYLQTIRTK